MSTDTSEKGLESLIVRHMTGTDGLAVSPGAVAEPPAAYGGTGYLAGSPKDYDRAHALDAAQLFAFLRATQPEALKKLALANASDAKDINRLKFLDRLSAEVGKRGVIDVLRKGIEHHPAGHFDLFYATPSEGNAKAAALHAKNRFSITRQLAYSLDETRRALDLGLFINGLPIATFELKNSLTKQTVEDAVEQYRRDRNPRERLFEFGRCVVHFAVDDAEVRMCTELKGKASWFLPFNKGHNDGAGNPPNPHGLKTDYLWKELLTPAGLTDILENYAQIVETKHPKTGKKKRTQVFPRYHQLDVVRQALADVRLHGAGRRYLIQHSAGSGKSNSIAWLAHQLIGVKRDLGQGSKDVFDSVIVVTDRRILDDQIQKTIKQFMQVGATVGHAEHSGDLRRFIEQGKKIIVTTVQKFPWVLDEIGAVGDKHFAIVIDEAHSGQGGKTSAAMGKALGEGADTAAADDDDEERDPEDVVNAALEARMAARKMLTNASYFAFTATPKNKTLEMFGEPLPADAQGRVKHQPFHHYSMKQAVQERFILDVLEHYVPVDSYYKLIKRVEDDPEFDTKRAKKKLRRYVESHDHAIKLKAEIMVDHFHEQVLAAGKIGGQARAMVVTSGIERAIQYFHAMTAYLQERKSPYQAIVAFSGEHEYGGTKVSEASLNGFPSKDIADKIQEDPYRFLVCADKFQTGYDEPLLHAMYVDKALSGVKAVQTLSRLNRAHPQKHDCFVLDFQNNSETITCAFQDYYRTTLLAEETDPNKLHDLKAALDGAQVYSPDQVQQFAALFLGGAERDQLDPVLDACVAAYAHALDEDQQVDFKGKAKVFCRTYDFLASVIPDTNPEWERLSILLNLLVSKLPAPKEEDLAKGILEAIDMDSYRVEKKALMKIALADADAEIAPVPTEGGGRKAEPELDRLSNILKSFNENFGTLFEDTDRVVKRIRDDIAPQVAADKAFQNARANTPHTARMAHDQALGKVIQVLLKDDMQVYKQFVQNESFRRFVGDMVYQFTSP
ncbi:type I restriction enzyme R subunit [Sphaerotilus sulfidivorans]|jgi:type I restriction enzyme R subunit|uniref:Type I restriction endonuclease subunit R n=1 Tax=Sphaerotilus sulfidivorans TaxID=639200 RepID=A0A5C1Q7W7_9BURK|nr:type I restriction endonuclease subunit R [Sphaerotilus sulfidivorans]NZD47522.1 type I restriction endonuclease subunit R [Sphaerotilus sulfidivorans]QEN02844.1 type I restriction endonuclease subunit R [Sphaerotilus sulfidivorans]